MQSNCAHILSDKRRSQRVQNPYVLERIVKVAANFADGVIAVLDTNGFISVETFSSRQEQTPKIFRFLDP